jgi:hypothetical protein
MNIVYRYVNIVVFTLGSPYFYNTEARYTAKTLHYD